MWKPGAAKPSESTATKSPTSDGPSPAAKKLSTSTMGMRFMQRKSNNNTEQEDRKAALHAAAAKKKNRNETIIAAKNNTCDSTNFARNKKRESEEISKEQSASSGVIILELASVVDMYGVGADIVGRRSFGGFHKSIRTTYDTALKRRTDDEARKRLTKSQITDDELLERYEKYVKGGRGGDHTGNRGRKEKRKRCV